MLTCKIGETILNSFDSSYDKYTLKQWSDRNILKCPICNGIYEYCHGEFVSPYFRHKEKDCSVYFTEPETDEHKQGKIKLYNWLKTQEGIINCKLEAWIPETKQRPDIYFEKNGKKFIIEFQCTPISTEYKQRRELYKLNNITDIWICGLDKYNLQVKSLGKGKFTAAHPSRFKQIEKEAIINGLLYFDVTNDSFIFHGSYMMNYFNLKEPYMFYGFSLEQVRFGEEGIYVNEESFEHLRLRDIEKQGGI